MHFSSAELLFGLQFLSGLFFFLRSLFLCLKKRIGWIFGVIAAAIIIPCLYLQMIWHNKPNLWILIVLDIALIVLFSYGYLLSSVYKEGKVQKMLREWNLPIKKGVVFLTVAACLFLLVHAITATLALPQFVAAVGFLVGTLLRAFNTRKTNFVGWSVYLAAHIPFIYVLSCLIGTEWLIFFQVFSLIVALIGAWSERKK